MHQKMTDVKAIIEANVELSKRIIKNNTLPIFHRIEWLRRHKNKDNLSNLNAEIDFTNEKISKLVSALKSSKKKLIEVMIVRIGFSGVRVELVWVKINL